MSSVSQFRHINSADSSVHLKHFTVDTLDLLFPIVVRVTPYESSSPFHSFSPIFSFLGCCFLTFTSSRFGFDIFKQSFPPSFVTVLKDETVELSTLHTYNKY